MLKPQDDSAAPPVVRRPPNRDWRSLLAHALQSEFRNYTRFRNHDPLQPRFPLTRAIIYLIFILIFACSIDPLIYSRDQSIFWYITSVATFTSYSFLSCIITIIAIVTVLPERAVVRPESLSWTLPAMLWGVQFWLGILAAYSVTISLIADGIAPERAGIFGKVITTAGLALPPLIAGVKIREWWAVPGRLVSCPVLALWRLVKI